MVENIPAKEMLSSSPLLVELFDYQRRTSIEYRSSQGLGIELNLNEQQMIIDRFEEELCMYI